MKRMVLILLLLFAVGTVYSFEIGDTLWTYNFNKEWAGINSALFSPDGQFIYANADYQHELLYTYKFTLDGKIVEKITGLYSGINQFSKDGKYFWTDNLYKYDYLTFKKVDSLKGSPLNIGIWKWMINEDLNIGLIVHGASEIWKNAYFEIFDPTTMNFVKSVKPTDSTEMIWDIDISPDGKYLALSITRDVSNGRGGFKQYSNRVEIWDAINLKRIKILFDNVESIEKKVGFSKNSKYFAFSGSNYLKIYNINDWSFIRDFDYTKSDCGLKSFLFSYDNQYLYIGDAVDKYKLSNYELIKRWPIPGEALFIKECPNAQILIGVPLGNDRLVVIDNGFTGVVEEKYEVLISLSSEIINNKLTILNKDNILISNYWITDLKGNTILKSNNDFNTMNSDIVIQFDKYPKGIYFFNTKINEQEYNLKFIKE